MKKLTEEEWTSLMLFYPTDADYKDAVVEIRRKMESVYKVRRRPGNVCSRGHDLAVKQEVNYEDVSKSGDT